MLTCDILHHATFFKRALGAYHVEEIFRKHVYISGKVQNVGFRRYMREEADELGLTGWCRNLPDRRVEAVFQGGRAAVEMMAEWCRRGSPAAAVRDLWLEDIPVVGYEAGFEIR